MTQNTLVSIAKRGYRRLPRGWTAALDLYLRRRHSNGRAPQRLDVMTSYGGQNLDVVQVLLLSLSEAHRSDQIVFWLLELRVPAKQIADLDAFCRGLGNVTLRAIRVPNAADFDQLRHCGGKPDSARFLWLAAHQHLPRDLRRVIYLDALDIIVTGDLVPLLHQPFLGNYLVACRESLETPPLLIGPARRAVRRGAFPWMTRLMSQGLMNSGAIVLNLDKFRQDDVQISDYIGVAQWARERLGLPFGDQGLFSLTHGSHYAQAHDRYNYRFFNAPRGEVMHRPAVIHYAGTMPKPFEWRLSPQMEQAVVTHLARTGKAELVLNRVQRVRPAHHPFFRQWWEICARTPVYDRIAPLALARAADMLGQLGVALPDKTGPDDKAILSDSAQSGLTAD